MFLELNNWTVPRLWRERPVEQYPDPSNSMVAWMRSSGVLAELLPAEAEAYERWASGGVWCVFGVCGQVQGLCPTLAAMSHPSASPEPLDNL